jgi:hypothetical protein
MPPVAVAAARRFFPVVIALAALAMLAVAARTEATDGVPAGPTHVVISPTVLDVRLEPGQSIQRNVRLQYRSGPDSSVEVTRHFEYADASGRKLLVDANRSSLSGEVPPAAARWSSADWVSTEVVPTTVRAGEERDLTVRISAPTDAEPGDHRAYLVVALNPLVPASGIGVAPSFAIRIYVGVPGNEVRGVSSLRLDSEHQGMLPLANPVRLVASLENTGTVSLQSGGEVVVERWLGGEVGRMDLPEERIVPGERARVVVDWPGPPNWELIGRYYARFDFADETLLAAVPPAEGFWVINWTSVGWAVAAIVGAWLLRLNRVVRAAGRGLQAGGRAFRDGMRGK